MEVEVQRVVTRLFSLSWSFEGKFSIYISLVLIEFINENTRAY